MNPLITKQLAEQIVQQTMLRLHRNINIMQTNGVILASGDKMRVNRIHEGAIEVARTKSPLWITKDNNHLFPRTKPGINLPIFFQEDLVGVMGVTGEPQEIEEISKLVQLTTEMMVHQALIVSEREWKRKIQELVFEELMSGQPIQKYLQERLNKIGFQNKAPFYAMMLEVDPESSSYQNIIEEIEFYLETDSILVGHYQASEHFILISGLDQETFSRKVSLLADKLTKYYSISLGLGREVANLEQVHYAYHTAKLAHQYGNPNKPIVSFEEVEIYSLFKSKEAFEIQTYTERLLQHLDSKLQLTLQKYFESNLQLGICAEDLGIHRHTLTYRLNKIAHLTGYNPNNFQDAIALQLALLLKD